MQDRTKDIRAAISVIADNMRVDDKKMKKDGPPAEVVAATEFLITNALIDLHTIARAQARMASLEMGKGR